MSEFLTICPGGGKSSEAIVTQRFTEYELRRKPIPKLEQIFLDVYGDFDAARGFLSAFGPPEEILERKRQRFSVGTDFYLDSLVKEILRIQDLLARMCE